jgi:hypothetical protein
MCRCSTPTWVRRSGGWTFTSVAPGGLLNFASMESASGTSRVIWLPDGALVTDLIVRSVLSTLPGLIQVCGFPPRVMSCICMNATQPSVTGLRMTTVSPAASPSASATVTVLAPEGT